MGIAHQKLEGVIASGFGGHCPPYENVERRMGTAHQKLEGMVTAGFGGHCPPYENLNAALTAD